MKSLLTCLAAAGLLASLMTAPGRTQVILEDNFNGDTIGMPDVGPSPWQVSGGTIPLVDGRAIFDPSVNNPSTVIHPDTGEELAVGVTIFITQRFLPAANFLFIPPASSGRMLEITSEVMDRGDESTPNDHRLIEPDATREDIDVSELRLMSGQSELYVPGFGNPFFKERTGNYFSGFTCGPGCEFPGFADDSGVPLPGFGESHLTRARIRSLPTGHSNEAIIDVSTDGGATYTRIGRALFPYDTVNGIDAEDPGFFTSFLILGRGDQNFPVCEGCPLGHIQEPEGEFSMDFIKIEELPFLPDKGDMDLDGDVDFDDINDFVLGLNDPNTYRSTFWVEASQNGDIDMDGDQDIDDIAGFVGILSGGGNVSGVPEPTTLLLAVLGALGAMALSLKS